MLRIINVVGARPNFMKIAPLVTEMGRHADIESLLVHTGQHYDDNLSRVFFDELGIPRADLNLGVGSGAREAQIKQIRAAFEPVASEHRPDAVLVVGDVNSTIACASVARQHGISVVHVEAGLRSFDSDMPEEHNRRETDQISDYLFVTELAGMQNLDAEGVNGKRFFVGNVMIDTLVGNLERARESDILERLGLGPRGYFASTFHRPSNVDSAEDLGGLIDLIERVCTRSPLVLPLHPRTRVIAQSRRTESPAGSAGARPHRPARLPRFPPPGAERKGGDYGLGWNPRGNHLPWNTLPDDAREHRTAGYHRSRYERVDRHRPRKAAAPRR